ncbi:MAG: alpha/beta hydrolase [Alphaproteobacteria bacterium]|nr:alpha/beta hydrolase [Alphaproteobacteria bacterium]
MNGFDRRGVMVAAGALAAMPATAQTLTAPPSVKGFKRAYADGPYGQIHYRYVMPTQATQIPLLCLHASPLSSVVYENWIVEIGRDRMALAPDTPGFGSSDGPPTPVEIPDFADAMIRLLDELKIERADVMGYHTGSFTSVDLARRYPNRIRKVVMISAPIFTPEELAERKKGMNNPPPTFEQMMERTLDGWRKTGKGMFRDVPTDDRFFDIRLDSMRRYRTSNWGFRAAYNYDLAKGLAEVKQPVLLLNPEDDVWHMTPRAKPYLNAQSRLLDLPGWTHGAMDMHTAEMTKIVRDFLDA